VNTVIEIVVLKIKILFI